MDGFDSDVLIVGAGPTGLALALWLTRLGVRVRIVDREAAPVKETRALAVQARTLELYRQVDLTAPVLQLAYRVPALNLWVQGQRKVTLPLVDLGASLSPYSPMTLPQDQHERLLCEHLQALGVDVQRSAELVEFELQADGVHARLRMADDPAREQICRVRYLAGCDGASSRVRSGLQIGFPGGTYQQVFYVADIQAEGPAMDGELHIDLDEADFLGVFPIGGPGRARLIGTVRGERAGRAEQLQFSDISGRAIQQLRISEIHVHWFSTYRVHHRVAARFRQACAFLLGDAAHIHSPAGGQGMNTGIGDAVNLAWKIAAVLRGRASSDLLDTYQDERQAFAQRLVSTTDRAFTLATAEGAFAKLARTRLVPALASTLFRLPGFREYLFKATSQLALNYRSSALSVGSAGDIHGGDRLPWVANASGPGRDNFESLRSIDWQVHVYGAAQPAIEAFCATQGLSLRVFGWQSSCEGAGLVPHALYLVRPDSYVALVQRHQALQPLQDYWAAFSPSSAIRAQSH